MTRLLQPAHTPGKGRGEFAGDLAFLWLRFHTQRLRAGGGSGETQAFA